MSGTTHIWTKWTGVVWWSPANVHESFFSEWRMPVPALIRWASPGVMMPLWPVESRWTSDPSTTQVTISMSRWGWVSKPAPGATVSSLLTSRTPWWVLAGSWWWPKENE